MLERFPAWQCAWLWESQPSLWLLRYFLSIHSFTWQIIDWARWRERCEWPGSYSHGVHHLGCTFHGHTHIPTRKAGTSLWTSCGQCDILSLEEVLIYFWIWATEIGQSLGLGSNQTAVTTWRSKAHDQSRQLCLHKNLTILKAYFK